MYRKFNLRENFENCTEDDMRDIHFVFDKVKPYWDNCTQLSEQERYVMSQCHAMCIRQTLRNAVIEGKRGKIMDRLRQEEAERRGYSSVNQLHLYYPHSLVDDEHPARVNFHMKFCEADAEIIEKALELSRWECGYKLNDERIVHLETMEVIFDEMREKLMRKFLL